MSYVEQIMHSVPSRVFERVLKLVVKLLGNVH